MTTTPSKMNRHTSTALAQEMVARNSTMTEAEAKLAVARVFDSMQTLLERNEHVRIGGFGTFRRKFFAERNARNPGTGEPVAVAAKHVIKFHQGKLA
jgi:nucleoid DNA-binding protein